LPSPAAELFSLPVVVMFLLLLLPLVRLLDLLPSLLLLPLPLVVLCSLVLASWLLVLVLLPLSFKVDVFLESSLWDEQHTFAVFSVWWGEFVYTKTGLFVSTIPKERGSQHYFSYHSGATVAFFGE
jgi:hypothetical protein